MPKGKRPEPLNAAETLAVLARATQSGTDLASKIQYLGIQTYIGKPYGDRQCPVWLPQDPNVPHDQRKRCVRWGPHGDHTDTYLIEEQTLD
jgi:hypothetical protein